MLAGRGEKSGSDSVNCKNVKQALFYSVSEGCSSPYIRLINVLIILERPYGVFCMITRIIIWRPFCQCYLIVLLSIVICEHVRI